MSNGKPLESVSEGVLKTNNEGSFNDVYDFEGSVITTNGEDYLITKGSSDGTFRMVRLSNVGNGGGEEYTKSTSILPMLTDDYVLYEDYLATRADSLTGQERIEAQKELFNFRKLQELSASYKWQDTVLPALKDVQPSVPIPEKYEQVVENNKQFYGDIIIQNPANFNDFTRQLIQAVKRKTGE